MAEVKTPEAYSLELDQIIDAETAHEYYWMGLLNDQTAFACTRDGCEGTITCKCMIKKADQLKKRPHFQLVKNHVCEDKEHTDVEIENISELIHQNSVQGGRDILLLSPPELLEAPKKSLTPGKGDIINRVRELKKEWTDNPERDREYKTVMRIINKYLKYYKSDSAHLHTVEVGVGNSVLYSDLFVNLSEACFDDLDKGKKIYYGKASVRKYDEGYFRINFLKSFNIAGTQRRVGTLVSLEALKKRKRNMSKLLSEAANKKIETLVYILGDFKINKEIYPVIQLNNDNMNYCDFR